MSKPIVAIVGRPNVGKSMLFNKLIGQRLSIVEDTPGVTRDRIYGECEWCGRKFTLVDTGGIEPRTDSQILTFMREQAQIAIENATVIIFLTDIKTGLTASDQEVANMLLRSRKPIVLAVNKMDSVGAPNPDYYEFYNLGLGDPVAVSAVHGHGTGDLLDACVAYFPDEEEAEEESDVLKVAIIGKPNVGKSSLTNRILGQERVIVSNVAGTTRDAIDSYFENETGKYVFIDTPGMRKKSRIEESIEKYSVLRATMAIDRADVCLIMIDATEGVTEQDTKVAGLAHEAGKACIIVVNKWDLVEKDGKTMDKMREDIRRDLSYMTYAPILFISAATGQRVPRLFELINYVHSQACTRITTGMLNNVLEDALTRVQPPTDRWACARRTSSSSAMTGSSSTSRTSATLKTASAMCSDWKARPSFSPFVRRGIRRSKGNVLAGNWFLCFPFSFGLPLRGGRRLPLRLLQRSALYLKALFSRRCAHPRQRQRGPDEFLPHLRREVRAARHRLRYAQGGRGGEPCGMARRAL